MLHHNAAILCQGTQLRYGAMLRYTAMHHEITQLLHDQVLVLAAQQKQCACLQAVS